MIISLKLGTIAHEVGHSIGFFHEQSRPDRDDYVVVNEDNVEPDVLGNYKKRTPDLVFTNVSYDLKSIMHYGAYVSTNSLVIPHNVCIRIKF